MKPITPGQRWLFVGVLVAVVAVFGSICGLMVAASFFSPDFRIHGWIGGIVGFALIASVAWATIWASAGSRDG